MVKTQTMTLNMGPQHPSTHGVFRLILTLEGETVVDVQPAFGYLHRGVEKWAEAHTYLQCIPITDRLDYICSMSNNWAYVLAVEKLAGIEVPERAEYIRVIMAEFTRIVNHLVATGFLLNDLGAFFTPVLYCLREREKILDLFEMASGSRMTCNYMRIGGVKADLPEGWVDRAWATLKALPRAIEEIERLLTGNEILLARTQGIGVLPPETAIAYSCSGPLLRGSGVEYDIRRVEPYSIYDRFDFDVITRPEGDVYARFMLRLAEIHQSMRILEQALRDLPEGEIRGKVPRTLRPPDGAEVYSRIETPKGDMGFYLVSNGSISPWRMHIRAPAFINLTVLPEMARGLKVPDVVVTLGSIDITLGEVDR